MSQPAQVIEVLGDLAGNSIHSEALAASGSAIKPGHIVEETTSDEVQEHSTVAGNAQKLVALTNLSTAKTIDDVYVVGEIVRFGAFHSGQEAYLRVAAGSVAIVKGDPLQSNGDGTVEELATDADTDEGARNSIIAYALGAIDNSGGSVEVCIKTRIA